MKVENRQSLIQVHGLSIELRKGGEATARLEEWLSTELVAAQQQIAGAGGKHGVAIVEEDEVAESEARVLRDLAVVGSFQAKVVEHSDDLVLMMRQGQECQVVGRRRQREWRLDEGHAARRHPVETPVEARRLVGNVGQL